MHINNILCNFFNTNFIFFKFSVYIENVVLNFLITNLVFDKRQVLWFKCFQRNVLTFCWRRELELTRACSYQLLFNKILSTLNFFVYIIVRESNQNKLFSISVKPSASNYLTFLCAGLLWPETSTTWNNMCILFWIHFCAANL